MIEIDLRERIDRLLDDDRQPDWADVVARTTDAPAASPNRPNAPRMRSLVAAAIVGAAITAVPALALSAPVRDLVGLKGSVVGVSSSSQPGPELTATLISAVVHHRRGADLVTVTFTVGETGKQPGAGIPKGSEFLIHVSPNRNTFTGLVRAYGANGRYTATTVVPDGGIASIQIGGWLNRFGMPTAATGFWVPVVVANNLF